MNFDLTVTLGNVISILATLLSLVALAWKLFSEIQRMKWKLDLIWRWYAKEHKIDRTDEEK